MPTEENHKMILKNINFLTPTNFLSFKNSHNLNKKVFSDSKKIILKTQFSCCTEKEINLLKFSLDSNDSIMDKGCQDISMETTLLCVRRSNLMY